MSECKRLNQSRLNLAFFRALVLLPHILKIFANVLALQEVSEDELVLVYCAFRYYQT